jgi:hypothetical protein
MSHQTIIVVDVASFTDPARTTLHQRAVREGLLNVLRGAFSEAGVELDTCEMEDCGDGKLILMPSGVDNARLVEGLCWPNAAHCAEAQVKPQGALYEGEAQQHGQGVLSPAVNLAVLIVDAQEAKTRRLAMIHAARFRLTLLAKGRRAGAAQILEAALLSWFRHWWVEEKLGQPPGRRVAASKHVTRGPNAVQMTSVPVVRGEPLACV